MGGGCAVAVHVAVCVVWWSVAGVCSASMVWGLVGVGGACVGVWGWVLVVGASSARCGRACRWVLRSARPVGGGCGRWCGVLCGRLGSGRCGLDGDGGCGWTAWWLRRRWAALMVGLGFVIAGGRVWWWRRDGVSLRVLLGVVPHGVWFVVTEHSPLRAARAWWSNSSSVRQCVPTGCSRVPPLSRHQHHRPPPSRNSGSHTGRSPGNLGPTIPGRNQSGAPREGPRQAPNTEAAPAPAQARPDRTHPPG